MHRFPGLVPRRRKRRLEQIEKRLVWIVGGPRTGSTWLLDLLTYPLTPDADAASGAGVRPGAKGARPQAVPINEPYLGVHLAPVVTVHPVRVFTPAEVRAGDASYFFDERFGPVWRPTLRRLILERLGAQADLIAKEHGLKRPLVVVKEPNGSNAAPMLGRTMPGSKLLFLLRDGRDVLDSQLDAQSPGAWMLGGPDTGVASAEHRLGFLRANATLWLDRIDAIQRALAAHPAELAMTVRYERLRTDTAAVLGGIAPWLGLDATEDRLAEAVAAYSFDSYPAEAKGRGKALRFATPGHWREGLSSSEQEAAGAIIGEKLRELGYEA